MKTSIILSFYNKIDWLKLVLAGYTRQSFKEFEIIIADDGSASHVVDEINTIKGSYPFKIKHVWHEDIGWNKNAILNKAILAAESNYIIFNDADCIPHRHFVKEHLINKVTDTVLAGRRVNLSAELTFKLTPEMVQKGYMERLGFLKTFLTFEKHSENGIYVRTSFLRKKINKKDKGILGSNFSLHKQMLLNINGFDERYTLPAIGEDTDLEARLRNYGYKVKAVKHLAIQYHLFHKTLPRDEKFRSILEDHIKNKIYWTEYGLTKTGKDTI
nr:glycosyltransferase [uncultured Carboxylicivirga sp.]